MHILAALATVIFVGQTTADPVSAREEPFFEAKIRPVLLESCFKCHGGTKVSGGLRVDSRPALLKGGERGPSFVPGEPQKSLLVQALRHGQAGLKMPPGKKLPDHVINDFTAWIKAGAVWPAKTAGKAGFEPARHWAFQPVQRVEPPVAKWGESSGAAEHPIDRFIAAKLRDRGLSPVAPASRRELLRRLTFDLIGLPPTPEEAEAFLQDGSTNALARVVDRLLASPHYGERWGRHWMDVVRYADTAGDNADYPIPEIYRYRDYIIDAFNADMPFDQFVQEQLAGDILAKQGPPEKFAERVVATGFLALNRRYATAPYEFWHLSLEDAIDTTGQAFLGLTMRCARCHDHKFDPILKEDYYGLYAIFASTRFPYTGSEEFASMNKVRENLVPLTPDADKIMAAFRQRLQDLPGLIKDAEKRSPDKVQQEKVQQLKDELRLLTKHGLPAGVVGAYAVQDDKPAVVHVQLQGDPDKPGAVAVRRVPKFLEDAPVAFPADGSGRLAFARWLTRPENPLTARVYVNRVWQYHFGQGLVGTPNNFGIRGEAPSHPELLDYLTAEFVKHGWSTKWLHRQIVSSMTYQLASTPSAELQAKDPDNRLLGRFSRRRLDAESLRDALLWTSGQLDRKRPGPHPFPPMLSWKWTQHAPFKEIYPSKHRSVYLMTQRIQRHPFLALFDGPDPNTSTEKRGSSLVPLQALYLMNHPFVREQAEAFARRLIALGPQAETRVARAHLLAWGRPATAAEIARGTQYVERYRLELQRSGEAAEQLELAAWTSFARVLLTANEFAFVD